MKARTCSGETPLRIAARTLKDPITKPPANRAERNERGQR